MDLKLRKSESDILEEEAKLAEKKQNFNYDLLFLNKKIIYSIAAFVIIFYLFYSLFTNSLISSLPFLGLIIISFITGSLYSSAKFSEGLEIAKNYLEDSTNNFDFTRDLLSNNEQPTGIEAIDEFYKIAEHTLLKPEEDLKRVKEELSLLLNNIAAAVILYSEDGSVQFCSPYVQVLSGYSEEELRNFTKSEDQQKDDFLKHIIIDEDWQRYKRARLVSHLGEDSLVRFRIKHKSDLTLWLESRMVPIINSHGDVQSVMAITIDVTDSINYQKQIEQQNQDLNDFAYMVSHDLKAPIFTIHGMADALKDDYEKILPKEAVELITFITDAAKRLDKLVASVLEYSALSNTSETQTEVSILETIQQVFSDHQEQLKNIDYSLNISKQMPTVKGDAIRFYQLFSNLIGNAIKYRNKSRSLVLNIQHKIIPPNLVQIEITDNGLGIAQNKLKEIFRPYRRAHGADIEGSGIGLACVKKIVEKLGGQVSVTSKEGEGSTFYVLLPLSKPAARAIPQELERLY